MSGTLAYNMRPQSLSDILGQELVKMDFLLNLLKKIIQCLSFYMDHLVVVKQH